MKILFISPRYSGGIGGHAAMLAEQLTKYGYEVTKMQTPHIPIKNLKNPSFAVFGTLKGILNKKKYDIVHGFNVPSAFAMHYTNARKKVLSVHGVFGEQVKTLHSKAISSIANSTETKVLKWADKLTTDSKLTQKKYKELGFEFEYLPSAIDTSMFSSIPNVDKKKNQIAYIGRDSFEKGIDILRKIEERINGKVVYCTNMKWMDAMKILKESNVLVVPSRMESLPTIIKEAFFLKVPVVATNVGGIPEMITHNENGFLIEPTNMEEMINTINNILVNQESIQKIIDNAYEFVNKNMTWNTILPRYVDFYENLLNS